MKSPKQTPNPPKTEKSKTEKTNPIEELKKSVSKFRSYVQQKKKELEEIEKQIEELEQKRIAIINELNEIYELLGLPKISTRKSRSRAYDRRQWLGTPMYQRAKEFCKQYIEKHGEPPSRQEVIKHLSEKYGYSERSGSFSPVLALLREEGLIKSRR